MFMTYHPAAQRKYRIIAVAAMTAIAAVTMHAQLRQDTNPEEEKQYINNTGLWGNIDYHGEPWVKNLSAPHSITQGLQGRHLSIWASHGRYYDIAKNQWQWQRPNIYCTTEDLFTQTIVVPYLIPMLERAGAYVFTPRERDWQRHEIIVDNDGDDNGKSYIEDNGRHRWKDADEPGFALHEGVYVDGENPFNAGSVRQAKTTQKHNNESQIYYVPNIPESGRYAVYVSYQTVKKSVDNAQYTVYNKGVATTFSVNQQMGGGTWVYLGTFDFEAGMSRRNCVMLTNYSEDGGVVTADAVRFGGGMGNIARGNTVSGLPRCLEGSRYYAQWAGMPYEVYSSKNGQDDYGDDINARSLMTNYLGGGSVFMPTIPGCKVPIELTLALHSDAGYYTDDELMGTLTICTTQHNDGLLNSGISRNASKTLAYQLRNNTMYDMIKEFGTWRMRYMWDRNYSESRTPEVPSAIMEMMSHQNFKDMQMAQDPNFKFAIARSIYRTLLKYICSQHSQPCVVAPLTPHNFALNIDNTGTLTVSATPTADKHDDSAATTSYIVYVAKGDNGFDNGTEIKNISDYSLTLSPDTLYNFRIAAANEGGVSAPSELLSAQWTPQAKARIMIINGFHRLASPAVIDDTWRQGFDMDKDPGLTLGSTFGWCGRQTNFARPASDNPLTDQFGSGDESFMGMLIAGNTQDYVRSHAEVLAATGRYTIFSCQSDAIDNGTIVIDSCEAVDLILGLEKNDSCSLVKYKTFSQNMQQSLKDYTTRGGALFVSGANVASDMTAPQEQQFLADVLKCKFAGKVDSPKDSISGMGQQCTYYHAINEQHYAAMNPDKLKATGKGYEALTYNGVGYAAVVYNGSDYRTMTCGFPMECIRERNCREKLLRDIFHFLTYSNKKVNREQK